MRQTAIAHRATGGLPYALGNSFIEIQPHLSIYKLYGWLLDTMAEQSRQTAESKITTLWTFTEKVC